MRLNFAFAAAVFILAASCRGDLIVTDETTDGGDGSTSTATSTHNGWTQIKAVGSKAPAAQGSDLATSSASVTLSWETATVAEGAISSYSIYRANSSGGQNYSSPLATGIAAGTRSYTDSTVTGGNTYYYTVAPVVNGEAVRPATSADSEVKVIVPRDNMVLLHRWAANKEICEEMGKTVDRTSNYRCSVDTGATAPPGTGGSGYTDLGSSLFIDMFEQGCNYTYDSLANKCGSANGCIGTSAPGGAVTGDNGDIYYNRANGTCYINTSAGSGTTWTTAASATAAQAETMASAAPGLPPFAQIGQIRAQEVCEGQTVAGFAGTKRLMKRREYFLAAAWNSSLADLTIVDLERGLNLDTNNYCNSSYASPQGNNTTDISGTNPTIAYDNLQIPAAKDTLPGCRFGDCAGTAATIRSVRTGSNATSACVSRYGAQDLVGNVWEWASDQISCNGATCSGVPGASNTADATNDDFSGVAFDGTQGPTATGTFTTYGKVQLPVGIPIAGAGFTGDGTVSRTADQFHGDRFYINIAAATRATRVGGDYTEASYAGRFALHLTVAPTSANPFVGFRCAIAAD